MAQQSALERYERDGLRPTEMESPLALGEPVVRTFAVERMLSR